MRSAAFTWFRLALLLTLARIWLLDLASQVPPTVQLDGYDLSSDQFPHKSILPSNMTFSTLDAFSDVPAELAGKYDVVHMRFWCCVVKGNDPSKLIHHAAALLSEFNILGKQSHPAYTFYRAGRLSAVGGR